MSNFVELNPTSAPAVFSRHAAANVSPRYAMVHTDLVLKAVGELGWKPTENYKIMKRNRRSLAKDPRAAETAKHMIRLQNENFPMVKGATPEIVFTNAHDKTGAIAFYCGILETVCANGLIAMRDGLSFKIYHVNVTTDHVIAMAQKVALQVPTFMQSREILQGVNLTENETLEFANRVIDLRWDGKGFSVNPADVVKPVFPEQEEDTLWNVFNRVQYSLVNGGDFQIMNLTRNKSRKAQGVKQINQNLKINTALWWTLEAFAAEKGVTLPALSYEPPKQQ